MLRHRSERIGCRERNEKVAGFLYADRVMEMLFSICDGYCGMSFSDSCCVRLMYFCCALGGQSLDSPSAGSVVCDGRGADVDVLLEGLVLLVRDNQVFDVMHLQLRFVEETMSAFNT